MKRLPVVILLLLFALATTWALNNRATTADASATQSATSAKAPAIVYALDAKGAVVSRSGGSLRVSMPANTSVMWFTGPPAPHSGTHGVWVHRPRSSGDRAQDS